MRISLPKSYENLASKALTAPFFTASDSKKAAWAAFLLLGE
jgi:hypothetical protein